MCPMKLFVNIQEVFNLFFYNQISDISLITLKYDCFLNENQPDLRYSEKYNSEILYGATQYDNRFLPLVVA